MERRGNMKPGIYDEVKLFINKELGYPTNTNRGGNNTGKGATG